MISRNPHRCFTTANSTENGDPAVLARNRWMVGVEIREWRGACVMAPYPPKGLAEHAAVPGTPATEPLLDCRGHFMLQEVLPFTDRG